MHVLDELWRRKIPWLVIEPTKREYRWLLESWFGEDLRVYTLGDDTTSAFRLNPLEVQPGVRVGTHIAALRQCLVASLPTFGPLPGYIAEALRSVYLARGWDLSSRAVENDPRVPPTLGDLYF